MIVSIVALTCFVSIDLAKDLERPCVEGRVFSSSKVFRVNQPVDLSVELTNVSSVPAWIDRRLVVNHHLIIHVEDAVGSPVAYEGSGRKIRLAPPNRKSFAEIDPNMAWIKRNVLDGALKISRPGTYKISLILSHGASELYSTKWGIALCNFSKPSHLEIKVVS